MGQGGPAGPTRVRATRVEAVPLAGVLSTYLRSFTERPRLVLLGNYGQGNLGDEAICAGLLRILTPDSDVTVMSRDPGLVAGLHSVPSVGTLSWQGVNALRRAKVVAIGGGGIFGNGMTLLPRVLPWFAVMCRIAGKRIIFVAIGAYVTTPHRVQLGLRIAARMSDFVSVRDRESAEVLGASQTFLVDDPGISLSAASRDEVTTALKGEGVDPSSRLFGISLKPSMHAPLNESQIRLATHLADLWCRETGGEVMLLCLSSIGNFGFGASLTDASMSEEVMARSSYRARLHRFGPHVHPALMKGVIGAADVVLAHRLHAQIFAWSTQTTAAGLSYERKSDIFLESVGMTAFDLRNLDHDEVVDWLRHAIRGTSDA